ncbi:unknown protein [Waddlia chondrophila 2032/99]|uniref:Uncharacterized protein n=1 Tax=Waddlia chondrophila 2032/99 TaxID=765953 RepID=F8LAE7_9BACT|nr:unknown protein [Waddlia chondrophila 2032/99]
MFFLLLKLLKLIMKTSFQSKFEKKIIIFHSQSYEEVVYRDCRVAISRVEALLLPQRDAGKSISNVL